MCYLCLNLTRKIHGADANAFVSSHACTKIEPLALEDKRYGVTCMFVLKLSHWHWRIHSMVLLVCCKQTHSTFACFPFGEYFLDLISTNALVGFHVPGTQDILFGHDLLIAVE
jgi:hypothetical protein